MVWCAVLFMDFHVVICDETLGDESGRRLHHEPVDAGWQLHWTADGCLDISVPSDGHRIRRLLDPVDTVPGAYFGS